MAGNALHITVEGDRAVMKLFESLEPTVKKKVIRPELRKAAKRANKRLVHNLSGAVVKPHTGRWLAAQTGVKPKAIKRSRKGIGVVIGFPEREELGIAPDDKWFYPAAVEHGTEKDRQGRGPLPAFAPIRKAVDDHAAEETRIISAGIRAGTIREAKKLGRKI